MTREESNQALSKNQSSFNQAEEETDTFILKRNPELMDSKVLDEIRAEIDSALSEELPNDIRTQISDVGIGLEIALKIIDRHRREAKD